ncbi:AAA family ATPase [Streptomyces sp. NPDC048718]|uniref:AAA family ATPase n=1 Tax=Streptomyces sp. NPDC048718 TaxID=3365587 RepID=UPI003718FAE6
MRLHRLRVTAFGPFATAQEVDFDALSSAGLFLLHGPTGAGKTSVLDAVCFALYGAVPGARQSPGTSLRSDHAEAGTPTEVLLELTVGERRLEITRRPAQPRPKKRGTGFTPEKAQSWLREYDARAGEWRALSRSHQEIGEEIGTLLGMSRDQFCQVVLLPQGDFARFLRADAEARGKLLGRLFDTRRFAAVEERLAELRQRAARQVGEGDERLLALAHRMAQAAGPASPGAAPVEQRPGEPGLADAVQTRAALARSEAREALDIARLRLAAAEGRQDAARTALDAARTHADRQARHAEALRRQAELAARRPQRDQWQTTLDRSRDAERVAPALALREHAERAHRTAAEARDQARARLVGLAADTGQAVGHTPDHSLDQASGPLPPAGPAPDHAPGLLTPAALADAGAEQLTAAEQRLRARLAGLESARRTERRYDEITAERAALDREARAAEESAEDDAGWLAGWEPRRAALRQDVEAAQEAAARAEQLAGRLQPARHRLAAARRRDDLAAELAVARERLTGARERRNEAHEHWLDVKARRLRGIAAELAAALVPGAPCQVCGSPDHPEPARATAGQVDRAAEDAAQAAYTRADEFRTRAETAVAATTEAWEAAREQARAGTGPAGAADAVSDGPASGDTTSGDPSVAVLAREADALARAHGEAHAIASRTHAVREALARAEYEYEQRSAAQREAERRAAARTSRREALEREQAALAEELDRTRGRSGSVAAQAALLERWVARLAEAAGAVRAAETTARGLKEADDRLAHAAFKAGFDTPAQAAGALLDESVRRTLQQRVDAWRAEAAAVADRLAEPATAAAAALPPADPAAAGAAYTAAERALREAATALAAARERETALSRLSRDADTEVRRLGPLREEYERVARLATLTAGTSAENERRMRLESYVLAARLEQVAAAATARLRRMSAGRYTLVHSDARSGGRRAGLGLHVVDAWTGAERDTATLSGGETFFASLALALGLADVVTDEAGGVRLDTLFIDEGFGSLDDQSLDEVLDVLDSLRERDRSVGIVSHVADLRRRVHAQLEVVKERNGSAVRQRGV